MQTALISVGAVAIALLGVRLLVPRSGVFAALPAYTRYLSAAACFYLAAYRPIGFMLSSLGLHVQSSANRSLLLTGPPLLFLVAATLALRISEKGQAPSAQK